MVIVFISMSHRFFDAVQVQDIINRYASGESTDRIAIAYGTNGTTVRNTLRHSGIVLRPSASARNPVVTDDQRQRVATLVADGSTLVDAARRCGMSKETAFKVVHAKPKAIHVQQFIIEDSATVLREYAAGVPIITIAKAHGVCGKTVRELLRRSEITLHGNKRYQADETSFDTLTPESLYWMGFLWADGCVYHSRSGAPELIVGLAPRDLAHLYALRSFLKSDRPIATRKHSVEFRLRSRRLCTALETRGFCKKRQRTPSTELIGSRDFWRGVVDGDGSIGLCRSRRSIYPQIQVAGQQPVLNALVEFFAANNCVRLNLTPLKGTWKIGTSGQTAVAMIKLLYGDAPTIALERKLVRARKYLCET